MRRIIHLVLAWVLGCPIVWAAPDTTLTISPSATSGTSITAADENDRNNDTSTAFNAHSHTDLSASTANTFNLGDGLAGNKNLCANAANSTDACIRWDDTAKLWVVDNPTAGTFNQVSTISGTGGLTTNGVVLGNGNAAVAVTAAGTTGTALIGNTGAAPSFGVPATATALAANGANCTAGNYPLGVDASGAVESCTAIATGIGAIEITFFQRTGAAGSGTINVAHGLGGDPMGGLIFCAADSSTSYGSMGSFDDDDSEQLLYFVGGTPNIAWTTIVGRIDDGAGNRWEIVVASDDATNVDITLTETGTALDITCGLHTFR